jgi:signal peptidase
VNRSITVDRTRAVNRTRVVNRTSTANHTKRNCSIVVGAVVLAAFIIIVSGVLPYRVYIVHTGSMSPSIDSRSAVIVRQHEYKVGQPISFIEQGQVITHRLVSITPDGTITTKGDANTTTDPWSVAKKDVIGGVIAAPSELGYWLMYFKNPLGIASIFLAMLMCWQIYAWGGSLSNPSTKKGKAAAS